MIDFKGRAARDFRIDAIIGWLIGISFCLGAGFMIVLNRLDALEATLAPPIQALCVPPQSEASHAEFRVTGPE